MHTAPEVFFGVIGDFDDDDSQDGQQHGPGDPVFGGIELQAKMNKEGEDPNGCRNHAKIKAQAVAVIDERRIVPYAAVAGAKRQNGQKRDEAVADDSQDAVRKLTYQIAHAKIIAFGRMTLWR